MVVEAARMRTGDTHRLGSVELTTCQSKGENAMIRGIRDDHVSQSIDGQSQWATHRC